MALTLTYRKPVIPVSAITGGRRIIEWKLTVGTYATDGVALAPSDVGMVEIDGVIGVNDCNGYTFEYDQTNDKLLAFASGGTQATNSADPNINDAVIWIIGS